MEPPAIRRHRIAISSACPSWLGGTMHLVSILSDLSIAVWQIFLFTGMRVHKMPCAVPGRQVSGCWVVCLEHGDHRMGACLWGPLVAWWWTASVLVFWLSKRVPSCNTCCDSVGEQQNQVLYPYCLLGAVPSMDLSRPMPMCHTWGSIKQGREWADWYLAWMTRCTVLGRAAWLVSVQQCTRNLWEESPAGKHRAVAFLWLQSFVQPTWLKA